MVIQIPISMEALEFLTALNFSFRPIRNVYYRPSVHYSRDLSHITIGTTEKFCRMAVQNTAFRQTTLEAFMASVLLGSKGKDYLLEVTEGV